ncbi:hypothetical protein MnTg03_00087 [bacterium MnTg03]|nr:hypothetical protein MnTg03_00087 [bacterium MnTg03]
MKKHSFRKDWQNLLTGFVRNRLRLMIWKSDKKQNSSAETLPMPKESFGPIYVTGDWKAENSEDNYPSANTS